MESLYAATVLEFEGGEVVDLRRPIGPEQRRAFERAGLDGAFTILSAWPAFGRPRSELDGWRLTHRLRATIAVHGVAPVLLLARSPDGAHREPSVAAGLDRRTALALARLYEQDAAFWFDGSRFSIDWTDARPPTPLP